MTAVMGDADLYGRRRWMLKRIAGSMASVGSSVRHAGDDLVSLDVGFDRFHARVLAEACRGAGLRVELLTMDESGMAPGLAAGVPHRLLVRQSELESVQTVLARTREGR